MKVIEIASVLAGPAVGMFFAELGAEVIKIENKTNFKELKVIGGLFFGVINLIFFLPFIGLKFLLQSK